MVSVFFLISRLLCVAFLEDLRLRCVSLSAPVGWMPTYVKDLRRLGRPLDRVLLVDNSAGVCVQPDNAIVVRDFFSSSDSAGRWHWSP